MRCSVPLLFAMALAPLHAQSVTTPPTVAPAPPPPPGMAIATSPVQLVGTISRFLINPNGDVDGLLLQDGTQVPVPPPFSSSIVSTLHVGDRVRVVGNRVGDLPLISQAQVAGPAGAVIVNTIPPAPTPPAAPPALVPLIATGTVDRPIYGPAGDVRGALLRDGTVLHIPRPAADQVQAWLQPGAALSARGFGIESRFGRAIQVTAVGHDVRSEIEVPAPPPPPGGVPSP